MSFLFWNIKYVYLPTIFEVVSFSRVSKYIILSPSFKLLKTTSCVERREWSSWVNKWMNKEMPELILLETWHHRLIWLAYLILIMKMASVQDIETSTTGKI